MKIVGLTGGIATGKSTVTALLRKHHIPVIDCDDIAHAITEKGEWGYRRVLRAFGTGILRSDGEIDRDALGSLIYSDGAARRRLNAATHPAVTLELVRQLLWHWLRCHWLVVVDMPLLFETGAHRLTWPRVLVYADPEAQVERLMQRDGISRQQADAKIAAQMPLRAKRAKSQHVVDNSGAKSATEVQVENILTRVQQGLWWQGPLLSPAALAAMTALIANVVCSTWT